MNVFIRAIVRIFSFGERLIVPFNEAIFLPLIALINIHYLYIGSIASCQYTVIMHSGNVVRILGNTLVFSQHSHVHAYSILARDSLFISQIHDPNTEFVSFLVWNKSCDEFVVQEAAFLRVDARGNIKQDKAGNIHDVSFCS